MDLGIGLTIVFGVASVAQWIHQFVTAQRFDAKREQLQGIKAGLLQFNAMCNDAEAKGDAQKPDAMARFISDSAHLARSIEHHADILLGNLRLVPASPPSRATKIIGWLFPLTRV
jgi:hypothetical protein